MGSVSEAARKKVEGLHLPVRVDWNRPLTRVLILKTGERLRTLHEAAVAVGDLALQLRFVLGSDSLGHHDSAIMDGGDGERVG